MLTREEAEDGGMKQWQANCLFRPLTAYYEPWKIQRKTVESIKPGMCDDVHVKDMVPGKKKKKQHLSK